MRTRTEARRTAILETAAATFMELGYDNASMAVISARVGGSKGTLYSYFPSKEELFLAVVMYKVADKVEPAFLNLTRRATEDPRTVLIEMGIGMLTTLMSDDALALKRLVGAFFENPDIGRKFWHAGPALMLQAVEAYLAAATGAGRLNVPQPRVAAAQLLALYEAEPHWNGPPDIAPPWDPAQTRPAVERAVTLFLAAYAPARG